MESISDIDLLQDRPLFKLGLIAHDYRRTVITSVLIICFSLGSLIVQLTPDWVESFGEGDMESVDAFGIMGESFGEADAENTESFYILVRHEISYDDQRIQDAVHSILEPIMDDRSVSITYSWEVDEANRSNFVNESSQTSRTLVTITQPRTEAKSFMMEHWKTMTGSIEEDPDFEIWITGPLAVDTTFDIRLKEDLVKSEFGVAPIVLGVLFIVFGSLVAGVLPLGVGFLTVISAMGITIWLSTLESVPVNNFASNIITLLGLGVSIDYSLFMIYRYREEIANGREIRLAIAITTATAGRAVFFSGLTVAVGLLGLLFFENTGAPSLGIGGTLGVSMAMLTSVVFLPALFAALGPKINAVRIPFGMKDTVSDDGMWSWIAKNVMQRPLSILIPILILLLAAGTPFLQAEYGVASIRSLPPDDMAREGLEEMSSVWVESTDNSMFIILETNPEEVLLEENLRSVHTFASELIQREEVLSVIAPGFFDPNVDANQTVQFWLAPELPPAQSAQRDVLRDNFISQKTNHTYLLVTLSDDWNTLEARDFVKSLRQDREANNFDIMGVDKDSIIIGGLVAYNLDVLDAVVENLPISIAFIFISTCILIFIQVRS
ncbi:MAG: MMPL family transporter, partial [Candidatus Thermoplasmatota archaeon]|nr:MMPL family transporter [Candidatus Thermoplasmatota archaeon]